MDQSEELVANAETTLNELSQRISLQSEILPDQYRIVLDDSLNKLNSLKEETHHVLKLFGADKDFNKLMFGYCELMQHSNQQLDKAESYLQQVLPHAEMNNDLICQSKYCTPNAGENDDESLIVRKNNNIAMADDEVTDEIGLDATATDPDSHSQPELPDNTVIDQADETGTSDRSHAPTLAEFGITQDLMNRLSKFKVVNVDCNPLETSSTITHHAVSTTFASGSIMECQNADTERTSTVVGRLPLHSCDNTRYRLVSSPPSLPVLSEYAQKSLYAGKTQHQ